MNASSSAASKYSGRSGAGHRGVTLIEAVLSLAILGIIMATIGAASAVMMRLMPRQNDPRTVAISISSALDLFDSDTGAAAEVQLAEPDQLRLLVNGLGDSGEPAVVVYEYDPDLNAILRATGAQTPQPILAGLTNAGFVYNVIERQTGEIIEPTLSGSSFGTNAIACSEMAFTVESGNALRQRIAPVLADEHSFWRIESIRLRLKQHTLFGVGTCRISFHEMNADGTMNATPFALQNIAISSLTLSTLAAGWFTYSFSDMPWLERSQGVAVLLTASGGSFRTHLASLAGYPAIESYLIESQSAFEIPGHLLCFELTGSAMTPGDSPPPIELMRSIELSVAHPAFSGTITHDARAPVPIRIQP